LLTLFIYFNEVEEGGYTAFPFSGPDAWPGEVEDWKACKGLRVSPQPNTCILWYNILPETQHNATQDDLSLHAGCDVIRGEKWAANKWIFNKHVVP
jgi:prolyl 4-hydroxylase